MSAHGLRCGDCDHWRGWVVGDTRYGIGTCERRHADVSSGQAACHDFCRVDPRDCCCGGCAHFEEELDAWGELDEVVGECDLGGYVWARSGGCERYEWRGEE